MVIGIFRSRLNDGVEAAYRPVAERMAERAAAAPGFLWMKTFAAADGERVTLFAFESDEALVAWRDDPEHRQAQARGRTELYREYALTVCTPLRESHFRAED